MHRSLIFLAVDLLAAASPLNVHVAFGDGSDISVSWQVPKDASCDSLHYGNHPDSLHERVESQKDCSLYKGDSFRHVVLTGLKYNSEYFYKLACSDKVGYFRTAAEPGSSESFKFAVYGDLGPIRGENTLSTLHSLKDELVGHIFAGDIGYADDAFLRAETYIQRTNAFLSALSPSSERLPIMVSPGNHEAEDHTPVCLLSPGCRSGLGNFTAYNCIWHMPSEGRRHSMWYSFNYGPIHFVMCNSETDYEGAPLEPYGEVGFIPTGKFGAPGEYEEWLRKDILQAHSERHIRPWIIVVGHRPITVLDDVSDPFKTPLNDNMISLIGEYADAYIAGHVHYYARSVPKPNSPFRAVSITVGGSGCDEWDERRLQATRRGETETMEFFGYGDEQTFGILEFDSEKPDELIFALKRSRDQKLVDRVLIPKRRIADNSDPVILSQ